MNKRKSKGFIELALRYSLKIEIQFSLPGYRDEWSRLSPLPIFSGISQIAAFIELAMDLQSLVSRAKLLKVKLLSLDWCNKNGNFPSVPRIYPANRL